MADEKDYNQLHEEYKKLKKENEKLQRQLNLIIKHSDRVILKNLEKIASKEQETNRLYKILNYADKQGKAVLIKAESYEKQLKREIEYEKELLEEIINTQREIVSVLGAITENRSLDLGNHVVRVAKYSKMLAIFYGLDDDKVKLLKDASPLHDIGKIAIPDDILNKKDKFTTKEWEIMKTHAIRGYEMLKHSKREILKAAAIIAKEHHEKWDGSGYPDGLKGEEIHIFGRITAVADVFDALSSKRSYKKAWSDKEIFRYLKEQKGKHFDPILIDIFFENLDVFLNIRENFKDKND